MGISYEASCNYLVNCIEERIAWVEDNYWNNKTDKNKQHLDFVWESWDDVDEDNIKKLNDYKIFIDYILRKMDK